jgi:hypothetical protein
MKKNVRFPLHRRRNRPRSRPHRVLDQTELGKVTMKSARQSIPRILGADSSLRVLLLRQSGKYRRKVDDAVPKKEYPL